MSRLYNSFLNLFSYLGFSSSNYHHVKTPFAYDGNDPLSYFLDMSGRIDYEGPFDENRIPCFYDEQKKKYHTVLAAMYGLGHLEIYRRNKNDKNRDSFITICNWLLETQDIKGLWWFDSTITSFGTGKKAISAMAQGLAISCLVRAFILTGEDRYRSAAEIGVTQPYVWELQLATL